MNIKDKVQLKVVHKPVQKHKQKKSLSSVASPHTNKEKSFLFYLSPYDKTKIKVLTEKTKAEIKKSRSACARKPIDLEEWRKKKDSKSRERLDKIKH